MKIKIRPDDASALQENDWLQTDGWLAELRDDGRADPASDGHARPRARQRSLAASHGRAGSHGRADSSCRAEPPPGLPAPRLAAQARR